jgi:hypothetical protein
VTLGAKGFANIAHIGTDVLERARIGKSRIRSRKSGSKLSGCVCRNPDEPPIDEEGRD